MPVVLSLGGGSPIVGRFLDRLGSRPVVITGAALTAVGMALLSGSVMLPLPGGMFFKLALFIIAGIVIGAGLSALLGAPMRYIMLNEASPEDRGSAQALLAIFTNVGQLISGAVVGAVAASAGGGAGGYGSAYLVVAVVGVFLTAAAFALKSRAEELRSAGGAETLAAQRVEPAATAAQPG